MKSLIKNKTEIIVSGSEMDCLSKFRGLSSFSFSNHHKYSFDKYEILDISIYAMKIVSELFKNKNYYRRDLCFFVMDSILLQEDIIKYQESKEDLIHDLIGLLSEDEFFVPRILKEKYNID